MRKGLIYITVSAFILILSSCKDFLELEPLDKVSAEDLLATSAGVKTLMATLYNRMPMEDFVFHPNNGYNQHPGGGGNGDGGWSLASNTDEAIIYGPSGYTTSPASTLVGNWDYTGIRYINRFLEIIDELKAKNKLTEDAYKQLFGEAVFLRASIYYSMVKRYGGVPILDKVQQLPSDIADVIVPRATEKETWDFVISDLDKAIANLPSDRPSDGIYRVTKWVALALKSRVTLHAASIAKFWNKAPLTGQAVDEKLVGGMTTADADQYYGLCIASSKAIMDNPAFSLYKPNPASRAEAAKNYQDMFEYATLNNPEIIYLKAYIDGTSASGQGHVTDFWFYPKQLVYHTLYMSSRWGTTLDAVDVYEDYTDDGTGASAPIKTRTDGVENYVIPNPRTLTTLTYPFIYYDNQYGPFVDKDARLTASVLLPGSTFKGTLINMQGGMVKQDGTFIVYTDATATGPDGNTYYSYGSPNANGYSAFGALGTAQANYSSTGFALRKYLQDTKNPTSLGMYGSTQPWVEHRLAEIYLNYAEAVLESSTPQGDPVLAAQCLNAIRRRAAHTDNIPLTIENVLKERRVELIFENARYWDLIRRRDFHTRFNATRRYSLIPIIDLRVNPPKYIFLRVHNYYDNAANGLTFTPRMYYLAIPGVATNKCIQNPEY